jgi:beta-lactamase regulating signal transducer with metallopeptidase domain
MSALEFLDGFSRAWGQWMLQMAWQVALLVLILTLLTWMCRRKSAVLLHTLWLLVLVRLVLPPGFAFPTGWAYWVLPAAGQTRPVSGELRPEVARIAGPSAGELARESPGTERTTATPDVAQSASSTRAPIADDPLVADGRSRPTGSGPGEKSATEPHRPAPSWSSYLLLAWAGVAGTLLALLSAGSLRVRRWVREAEPIDDPVLYSLLEDCRERLGIRRLVELRNSEACTTPVVVGFRRPVILLPREVLSRLNEAEMRAVLMHELNHIARGDAIVNLLQGVLGALYFFHPLVWWANASLRRLREEACDEQTVAALDGERRTYGEAIVKVTEIFGYASPPLALGVLESKNPARERLGRILDPQLPQREQSSWRTAAAVIVLAALLLPGAGGRTSAGSSLDVAQSNNVNENRLAGKAPAAFKTGAPGDANESPQAPGAAAGDESPSIKSRDAKAAQAGAAPPALDGKGPLRYRWVSGRTYVYSVQIEAEDAETIEVLSGRPSYTVRRAGNDGVELVFNGRLMASEKMKSGQPVSFGRPPRFRGPFSSFSGVGLPRFPTGEHILNYSDRGSLQSMSGQSQLPYVLGNLSQLVIVPFPEDARAQWEESGRTTITLKADDDRHPFPRSPLPRPPFGPFADRDEGRQFEARERSEYQCDEPKDNTVVIHKQYELQTTQMHDVQPRLALTGEAVIMFDLELGVPTSLTGQYKLTHHTENTTLRTPLSISARLLSDEERIRLESEASAAGQGVPLDSNSLNDALADLMATESFRVQNAATKLERAEPQGRREEVARALEPLLTSPDKLTRQAGARALAVWGTRETLPVLVKALNDEFAAVPQAALQGLARLQDARAIEPILGLIRAGKHRTQAVQAFAAMGGIAEEAALGLLDDRNSDVRFDACLVLKTIGGEKSVRMLEKTSHDDENAVVRLMAERAVEEIRDREK